MLTNKIFGVVSGIFICRIYFSRMLYKRPPVFRPSVSMSVRPYVRSQFTSSLAFKSLQMTYSLIPLHPWSSNFTCGMISLQGFRTRKLSLVENPRWPQVLKISKLLKSTFSPELLRIFGWIFAWIISGTLVFKNIKMKNICSRICHRDLFYPNKIYIDPNIKVHSDDLFSKNTAPPPHVFFKIHMQHHQTAGFLRLIEFSLVENPTWPP